MVTEPMGPLGGDPATAAPHIPHAVHDSSALSHELATERIRAEEAERFADVVANELAAARVRIERLEAEVARLERRAVHTRRYDEGPDPRILPLVLGATALVAAMVFVLALLSSGVLSLFTWVMAVVTGGLGWWAWQTRLVKIEVTLADDGVVRVSSRGAVHRYDLSNPLTRVTVLGEPGEAGWQMRLERAALPTFVIDAGLVDPEQFTRRVQEYRDDV